MGFFVAVLALAQGQAARGVTVRAQIERANIVLGDSVEMQVIVYDSTGGTISASVPEVEGLEISRSGSGWRFENGRRSDILNYTVSATREGRFVIPPIAVQVNGQTFRSNQLVVVARRPSEAGASMRLTASVSKKECYVFEPVDVTFKWYISSNVRRYELNIPLLNDKDELSLKLLPPGGRADEILATRYTLRARVSSEVLGGTEYSVRSVSFRIFPAEPGMYVIRRATVSAFVQSGYRTETDFLFGNRRVSDYKRTFASSDPIEIVVKDLPGEGKPAGFTGAVGHYGVSVETADTKLKVGDPITLRIIVSGKGLLEKIKRPPLSEDAAFSKDFLISESLAPGDVSGDRVTFEQTIRAKSETMKEIPSVSFAYFDPDRQAYEITRSRPIAITVLPTAEVTAEDVIKFGPAVSAAPITRLEEQPGGILANYNHLDALENQAVRWSLLSLAGLPPAAYLIILAVVSRRRKLAGDAALARSKSARKALKKHLAEAREHLRGDDRRFYDSLARGISRFTSDKLNLGTGELTAYDVESLAMQKKISEEISREISKLLIECDAGRFTPSAESLEDRRELLRRAEELLRTLGKTL